MVPSSESKLVEADHERGNFLVPGAVGQAEVAIDYCQRFGIARDAREEARAEIKHRATLSVQSTRRRDDAPGRSSSARRDAARVGRLSRQWYICTQPFASSRV